MKPHSHDVGVARAFDCFCKKVLRNEARDYQDALARKRNREVYFSELPVEVLEQFAVRDGHLYVLRANEASCIHLPSRPQRRVIRFSSPFATKTVCIMRFGKRAEKFLKKIL